ncbi:hypothetical protein EMIT048CA2_190013 [Pseudomonas chlororaphis]
MNSLVEMTLLGHGPVVSRLAACSNVIACAFEAAEISLVCAVRSVIFSGVHLAVLMQGTS